MTPKTVVRSGGGIYYVRDIGNAVFDTVRNAPFTIRRDEPAETFRPNLSFEQPFARTGAPTFILAAQCDEPSSYVGQWSVGVQRELPGGMSLDATYFGSAGVHLRRLMSYNNPEPSQQANSNLARPFPQFGSIQVMSAPGHSNYHALYLKVQRRFSQGLSFLSSFSYGKSIDNGSGVRTTDGDSLTPVEQLQPRARDRAVGVRLPPPLDDVVAVGPAGRQGQALPEPRRRVRLDRRRLADRRHRDAAGRLPVHRPVRRGHDPERRRRLLSRSDRRGVGAADDRTRTRWFNTNAFVDRNPAGGPFRYGTVARNSLIGPGIVSVDASANKRFPLKGATLRRAADRGLQRRRTIRSGTSPATRCGRRRSA